MIISRGRRYIFVHIPKTGGTALSLALETRAMKDDILIGDTPKAKRRRHRLKDVQTAGRLWKHSTLADIDGPTDELLASVVSVDDSPMHRVHMEATSRDPGNYRGGGEHEQAPDEERHHSPEEIQADPKHSEGAILCMDCHGSSNNRAHQFRPSRQNCLQCHGGMAHAGGRLDDLVCQECHFDRFVGAKPSARESH